MPPYLSVGAVYRNEARYLREWIDFHLLVGVERFFLYNNRSTDHHLEVLELFRRDGTVVWEDFPEFPPQLACYNRCIETHANDARWIAFIDIDEFLFSPTGRPVPEVLEDFENHPGVAVNCVAFGTSGHQTPPAGPVVENYTRRLGLDRPRSLWVKSIIDPRRALHVGNTPLYFRRTARSQWTSATNPVRGHKTDRVSIDRLRMNHYFTKSQVEREHKLRQLRAYDGQARDPEGVEERDRRLNEEQDETILRVIEVMRAVRADAGAI